MSSYGEVQPGKLNRCPPPSVAWSPTTISENRKPKIAGFSGSVAPGLTKRTLLPIVPEIMRANGKETHLFALLDGGSEISVITKEKATLLGLEGRTERVITKTVDGESQPTAHKIVKFDIASLDGRFTFNIMDVHVMDTFRLNKNSIDLTSLSKKWPHLALVPIYSVLDEDVAILIGQDHPAAIEIFETRKDPYNQRAPRAYLTAFGWCVAGPTARPEDESRNCFHLSLAENRCDTLLQQFIEFDIFGIKPNVVKPISPNESLENLEILWKLDDSALPNNFFAAQRRIINTYVQLKQAHKLTKEEIDAGPPNRTWYNPHHPVFNPNKPGKCRVVFDLSAKCHGTCLNDVLLRGPDLLTNLVGILLFFRQYAVPLVADIEKMFHQVRVRPIDGPAFRFLWRDPGSTKPVDVYRWMCIFSAPFPLQLFARTLYNKQLRTTATIIFSGTLQAISTAHSLTETLGKGGFPLTQWATSNSIVRQSLTGQQLDGTVINMDLDAEPIERTLGLVWNFHLDAFILGASVRTDGRTKRDLLKAIFSIFDPLGFLVPIVFQAKFLMQDIWRQKFDWDEELDQDIIDRWIQWARPLPSLNGLVLDRCITPASDDVVATELHAFGDASEMGYGAVCYARFVYRNGTANTRLLISKTRVAPLKFMTIPHLELNAAVLAARLAAQVREEHDLTFGKTTYWSDSTTVLSWIKSSSCRFHTYVGNRIGEILETSSFSEWNYVPSTANPADDSSRGLDATEFNMEHRWFSGPDFLKFSTDWPCNPSFSPMESNDPEIRETTWVGQVQLRNNEIDQLIGRKSRIHIIIRTVEYFFRFIANARKNPEQRKLDGLSAEEISLARNVLLRHAQSNVYCNEVDDLRAGRQIESSFSLIKLSPYMDHRGLLCVGGRIDKAPLPMDTRHPIILPS
ncbi:uncharacterized protein LOC116929559 [Daphnia magna]|uniref:uncharacterized protein LOC116929559 n=1 Tax=Daphnia magna TaxID=35525 RepID=UPI001E1BABBF|nr:uncharacterized protein LOC116929559 [Daphnia magna]